MPKRVVAISQELGAEAEQVGRLVAERLGSRYVDEEAGWGGDLTGIPVRPDGVAARRSGVMPG